MFQSEEPCPCWKMKTTIPNAPASETRLRRAALSGRTIERKAREQDQGQHEHVGEVAVDGVDEVAVGRGRPAECPVRALERAVDAVDDALDSACGPVDRGQCLDD